MLNDMEIMKIFGLPNTTSRDWKKRESSDWRQKVYLFLQAQQKNVQIDGEKRLKIVEVNEIFGIPKPTIQDWKKTSDDNWRKKVYLFLQAQNAETVKTFFETMAVLGVLENKQK